MIVDEIIFLINETLDNKLRQDENYIRYTFYEIRVKLNLNEEEANIFLNFAKTKLNNMEYIVYFTDEKYEYKDATMTVQPNELMIAIKH